MGPSDEVHLGNEHTDLLRSVSPHAGRRISFSCTQRRQGQGRDSREWSLSDAALGIAAADRCEIDGGINTHVDTNNTDTHTEYNGRREHTDYIGQRDTLSLTHKQHTLHSMQPISMAYRWPAAPRSVAPCFIYPIVYGRHMADTKHHT